ncbi:flagellar hook-basal body complex protein FliE [Actinomadura hibisca]|uniref:flagellar hook-basal body complex protein FliE n=1 Tax=Actinomadura hibisca TaxID=68565 RepID=UPI0008327818|nr:flagellar hook-basal body complex protein FliE [Actinomadura hibisca]
MTINAIGALGAVTAPAGATAVGGTAAAGGAGFADMLAQGLEGLQATQAKADTLGVQAATGSLTDVHDYMIASTQASLATQLTVAVRDKAVNAFNEIMRMQA